MTETPLAAVRQYIEAFNEGDAKAMAEAKQHGASGYVVGLGEPLHDNVTGESASVVVPATMTFNLNGKQVTQTGALFTVVLRKLAEGWRIAAWAWTKGKQ